MTSSDSLPLHNPASHSHERDTISGTNNLWYRPRAGVGSVEGMYYRETPLYTQEAGQRPGSAYRRSGPHSGGRKRARLPQGGKLKSFRTYRYIFPNHQNHGRPPAYRSSQIEAPSPVARGLPRAPQVE